MKELSWLYAEDGVAWFESDDGFTADLPIDYSCRDEHGELRTFTLTESTDVQVVLADDGLEFLCQDGDQKKALYVKTKETEEGFEIEGIQIFHIVTKQ